MKIEVHAGEPSELLLCLGRRWVVGKLLLLFNGAFYADVVEEKRGGDGGLGDGAEGVVDVWRATGGDDGRAQRAVIKLIEDGAADERA